MANVNCLRCRFRHEDNGNCTAVGGFCTAVQAAHCPLLREYLDTGLEPAVCANYKTFEDEAISKGVPFKRIVALMEADRAGRLVVLPCKVDLEALFERLSYERSNGADAEETYTTGYRCGHRNGQIELLQRILGKSDGTREEAEAALEAKRDG